MTNLRIKMGNLFLKDKNNSSARTMHLFLIKIFFSYIDFPPLLYHVTKVIVKIHFCNRYYYFCVIRENFENVIPLGVLNEIDWVHIA